MSSYTIIKITTQSEPVLDTFHPDPGKALGRFIQARRAQVTPEQVGLRGGMRRRTPGLRREELAQLSGISVTWMTWIEQGRSGSISQQTLLRVAQALQLTRAERTYMFGLAGKKDPANGPLAEDAPEPVRNAVHQVKGPSYLLDRYWDTVAWNPAAKSLFRGWLDQEHSPKNLLHFMFCTPSARTLVVGWEQRARRLVAEFRADTGQYPDDPKIHRLAEMISRESPLFLQCWKMQDVIDREGGQREFNHPTRGRVGFQQITLRVANRPDLKLIMLIETSARRDSLGRRARSGRQ